MNGFGAELKRWMQARGIGVRELHRRSGYSAGYITQLRQGRRNPSMEAARDLDDALNAGGALIARARARDGVASVQRPGFNGVVGPPVFEDVQGSVLPAYGDDLASALTDLDTAVQQEPVTDTEA